MKNLRFKKILLISRKEKTAREVSLNNQKVAILGPNGTGKSSLIKSLYAAFGADPEKTHPKWKRAGVEILLEFSVDGDDYTIVRKGSRFGLFEGNGAPILITSKIAAELAPQIAELLDFKLRMKSKSSEGVVIPPPAFCFLPFYSDQDDSWTNTWNGFSRLQMMADYKREAAKYHSGMRPNAYYDAMADKQDTQLQVKEFYAERKSLGRAKARFDKRRVKLGFDMDPEQFAVQISKLLVQCELVREKQDAVKATISELFSERVLISEQVRISKAALKELDADYKFSSSLEAEVVLCPTCGTSHDNNFASRFSIVSDADSCRDFIGEGEQSLRSINARIDAANNQLKAIAKQAVSLERLLSEERGKVKLRDLLSGESDRILQETFDEEFSKIDEKISKLLLQIKTSEEEMSELTNRERRAQILETYTGFMTKFLKELDVHSLAEADYKTIEGRIKDTGSELPRAILAYKFAFLHTMLKHSSSPLCPMVIDSPLQQDQDDDNVQRILNFVLKNSPADCQLILGSVKLHGVKFDGLEVSTSEKGKLLNATHFEQVKKAIDPFIDQLFA
jgi:energy-coupling factor transporter ATP-binding protein EcfA2